MASNWTTTGEVTTESWGNHDGHEGLAAEQLGHQRSVARWRLVWSSRRLLGRVTGLGLLTSLVIAFVIPTRYRSTARLMPPDQGSSGMGMAMMAAATSLSGGSSGNSVSQLGGGLGSLAGDLLGIRNSSDLFVGMLHSRTVQDDLINKFNLKKRYHDSKMEDARDDLDRHTDFSADRKSGIISIQVVDHDPKQAAAMAGEYVSMLNQVVTQLNTSSAHRERVFLENRLVQVKDDLESAEKNFSVFASKNTTIDLQSQAKAMIEAGAALEGQLIAAQTELQGLRQIYSDTNVRVRALQARVNELQRQIQNLGGKYEEGTDPQTATGPGDAALYPSIRKLPLLGVNYADLYRNTKVAETLFEVLTRQYELAKVQEAKETPSVKVLDAPDIPQKRSFPPRILLIVLGTILAFFGGVMFVLGRTQWEGIDAGDARKAFAMEVYGTVRARLTKTSSNGSTASSNGSGAVHAEHTK
jgi:capsule polysaccharide export protein KpsE/RkpR